MPRQPVPPSSYRDYWEIGRTALVRRPEHAALIARCLGAWPEVELQMAMALGQLMRAQSPEAVAVYLTLRRSSSRSEALEAAARRLNARHMELFRAVMMVVASAEKERNFLAHNIYAYSGALPGHIGCGHQTDLVEWSLELIADNHIGFIPSSDVTDRIIKKLYVYTIADLAQIHDQIEDAWGAIYRFNAMLRAMNHDVQELVVEAQYIDTSQQAPVREALARLRERAARRAEQDQPPPPT